MTWRYTDETRRVVVSTDGRQSCLASALPAGTEILPHVPKPPSIDDYKRAIEERLAQYAAQKDYVSFDRLLAHAASPNPRYRAEAAAAWAWKDSVDAKAYEILADVQSGRRPVPTVAELLSELPADPG